MSFFLGVDCGGTKTTCVIADASGKIVGRGHSGASNYAYLGTDAFLTSVRKAVASALESCISDDSEPHIIDPDDLSSALSSRPIAAAWLGIAGGGSPAVVAALIGPVERLLGLPQPSSERIAITNDAHLLALSFLRFRSSLRKASNALPRPTRVLNSPPPTALVLIAGTGSVCYAFEAVGHWIEERGRVGGWGWMLGDEGSGRDVGREAVRRIMLEHDQMSVTGFTGEDDAKHVDGDEEDNVDGDEEDGVDGDGEDSVDGDGEDSADGDEEDSVDDDKEDSVDDEEEDSVDGDEDSVDGGEEDSVDGGEEDSVDGNKEESPHVSGTRKRTVGSLKEKSPHVPGTSKRTVGSLKEKSPHMPGTSKRTVGSLKEKVLRFFRVQRPLELPAALHAPEFNRSYAYDYTQTYSRHELSYHRLSREERLSKLCPFVFKAAFEDGDPLALSVLQTCARALASQATTLLLSPENRSSSTRAIRASESLLCLGGSLFGIKNYRQMVLDELRSRGHIFMNIEVVDDPAGDAAWALATAVKNGMWKGERVWVR